METIRVLVASRQFGAGLIAGLVCALGAFAFVSVRGQLWLGTAPQGPDRSSPPRMVPGVVGAAFCLAALAAIDGVGPLRRELAVPIGLWAGSGALVVAGAVAARLPRGAAAGMLLALPGGALLAGALPGDHPAWAVVLVAVGPAIAGAATADLDARFTRSGTAPLLFLVALGGAYLTLPDTELVLVALGAALPVTVLAWPIMVACFGSGGSYAATGVFLWIAVVEGIGRPGSTVGAAACLGILVVEPLGRFLAGRRPGRRRATPDRGAPGAGSVVLVLAQSALALYFARVAGFEQLAAPAAAAALPVALAAVLAVIALSGGRGRGRSRPG